MMDNNWQYINGQDILKDGGWLIMPGITCVIPGSMPKELSQNTFLKSLES